MSRTEVTLGTLMVLAQSGDRQAYRAVLETARVRLIGYFTRRLSADPGSAEDLVQDTLMAVHEKRATYDPTLPFGAWLHGIARYKLIDHYRRHKRRETIPLGEDDFAADTDDAAATLARIDVDAMLARLPQKQAAAIRLIHLQGHTAREAAERLGAGESAVKVSAHRGLKAAAAHAASNEEERS
ncbi:sigma-70 family RNA polymerase sigma factor [Hyphobacterium sp. SN044]|uniref:sigma-70 family RNA polymerase sigma factor n=1 Tax=Hyphobacterium sp. SN044 TaxID=2912575 RepID=UPI001F021130|nr:sigma-70 family RNA polymerase sigma factor [Hyphobacterium sp. SN044]MCF8880197.1 sigma-70 family RNA polymerase sigma factor [Hyphobacterium sp. SN044]